MRPAVEFLIQRIRQSIKHLSNHVTWTPWHIKTNQLTCHSRLNLYITKCHVSFSRSTTFIWALALHIHTSLPPILSWSTILQPVQSPTSMLSRACATYAWLNSPCQCETSKHIHAAMHAQVCPTYHVMACSTKLDSTFEVNSHPPSFTSQPTHFMTCTTCTRV